ncbi:hypothetical protein [Leifsonia soli]|uniref:Uncharacterized protein n=1 Tax=Leifsonia soli TaxID=582665 RepID=A0A852SWM5_9MICO|nr:hypothetical protein [Leifsonia soli]NYD73538.1 hypothetical protein [Leifsonia soli]
MSDLTARFPPDSAVRAVRFPTTARAIRSLGGVRLPIEYAVVVDAGRVGFVGRGGEVFWDLPASAVHAVSVGETRSSPPYPQVSLAIILEVRVDTGTTDLPIVPVSDDGKRSLTWRDEEVRALARRLVQALGTDV